MKNSASRRTTSSPSRCRTASPSSKRASPPGNSAPRRNRFRRSCRSSNSIRSSKWATRSSSSVRPGGASRRNDATGGLRSGRDVVVATAARTHGDLVEGDDVGRQHRPAEADRDEATRNARSRRSVPELSDARQRADSRARCITTARSCGPPADCSKATPSSITTRFDAEQTLQLIEAQRVDTIYMVPTMMQRVWNLPDEVRRKYDVSSLQDALASRRAVPGVAEGMRTSSGSAPR